MNTWNYLTFSDIMKFDPKKAFEYRFQTLGEEIPEEYRDVEVKEEVVETKTTKKSK